MNTRSKFWLFLIPGFVILGALHLVNVVTSPNWFTGLLLMGCALDCWIEYERSSE